ncbi:MAG: PspA/IM30 family protein [Anaerolineales bacterium]
MVFRILKGWLRELFQPAEDPRQTFAYSYERQRNMLTRVQLALKEIQDTEARLANVAEGLAAKLPLLQDQARRSISRGREDLARNALERRAVAESELENIKAQLEEVGLEERRLALVESRLSSRIEAFYARQEVIAARYSAAEAQVRIQEALSGLSDELADLGKSLDITQERTTRMQAKAYAIDRLVAEGMLETTMESQAPMDLTHTPAIERQLKALKCELESEGGLEG